MKRKTALTTIIFCAVIVSLIAGLQAVEAQSYQTITIKPDGSIEGTDKIVRDGNNYTFVENINCSVVVECDNIVIDGAGFVLQGTGSLDWIGVDISSRNNVTVNNIVTKLCGYDIRLSNSSNCIISDIFVEDYLPNDIYIENSSDNVISRNFGEIKLYESCGNILLDNLWSLKLSSSFNNTISGNRNSIELSMSPNNTISKNNSSVRLFTDSNGNVISENSGFIGFWESSNNSIIGNNGAILIFESHNNTILQNTIEDNSPYGVELSYSSDNIFSENIIKNNKLDIRYVSNTTFYQNDFVNASIDIVDDSTIFWDNGSEGNYWNDYSGLDENGDGLGDTPYIIDVNNKDNYPLMSPIIFTESSNTTPTPSNSSTASPTSSPTPTPTETPTASSSPTQTPTQQQTTSPIPTLYGNQTEDYTTSIIVIALAITVGICLGVYFRKRSGRL